MSKPIISKSAKIVEPCYLGDGTRLEDDVVLGPNIATSPNTTVKKGVIAKNCFLSGIIQPYTNWDSGFAGFVERPNSERPVAEMPLKAVEALEGLLKHEDFKTVIDVGSGSGKHADLFEEAGKTVTRVDLGESDYFDTTMDSKILKADITKARIENKFDCVWASHVLEHQPNAGLFIECLKNLAKPDGIICITVPPLKHDIVGGHLSVWNAGLLLYNLVFAGIDCSDARVKRYGYNISVIVKNCSFERPSIDYDRGDITRLRQWFPDGTFEPFNGNIEEWNWYESGLANQ